MRDGPNRGDAASESAPTSKAGEPPVSDSASLLPVAVGAGAMTMLALSFANGLQGGMSTTFAQSIDAIKHTFHVNDATIGIVPAGVTLTGNFGAVPIAAFCARHKRTAVLAAMFVLWGMLIALAGLTPAFSALGIATAGFALFAIFRIASAVLEATDPASLPLIADWWPVEDRAKKVSVFNTVAAAGAIFGLVGAGVLIDTVGWRWAFVIWTPVAFLGAFLIRRQREPVRGAQDVAYRQRLEDATAGAEHDRVVELVEHEAPVVAATVAAEMGGFWGVVRSVVRLRSWRLAAIGLAVTGIMGGGIMNWGLSYFKRTFHMNSTEAGALAPVLGLGAFVGVFAGGFIADRLLARGMLRARLYVTVAGYGAAGLVYMAAFSTTRLVIAAPLLGVASALGTLPTGPQFAVMMDTTPSNLRSQASAALNVLQATGFLGPLLVGGLSTLFGENLRLALLCVSPFYVAGAVIVAAARKTYIEDVALVVAEARGEVAGRAASP